MLLREGRERVFDRVNRRNCYVGGIHGQNLAENLAKWGFQWKHAHIFLFFVDGIQWNCSFTRFYAKKALFFVTSFSETLTVSKSFRQFFWNWSETANSFSENIKMEFPPRKGHFLTKFLGKKIIFFEKKKSKDYNVKKKNILKKYGTFLKKCPEFFMFETVKK